MPACVIAMMATINSRIQYASTINYRDSVISLTIEDTYIKSHTLAVLCLILMIQPACVWNA